MVSPQPQNYYQQPSPEPSNCQPSSSYSPSSTENWSAYPQAPMMNRSATYPQSNLPPIQTYQRNAGSVTAVNTTSPETWHATDGDSNMLSYRHWENGTFPGQHYTTTQPDSPIRANNHDGREQPTWQQHDDYTAPPAEQCAPGTYSGPPPTAQTPPPPYYPATPVTPTQQNTPPSSSRQSPTRPHMYTRTLVGPLSANACRLMDEQNKSGVFFLFQDLSVRTEGTFRLRMRLMNVGA